MDGKIHKDMKSNSGSIESFRQRLDAFDKISKDLERNQSSFESMRKNLESMREDLESVGALAARSRITQMEMFERLAWRDNASRFGVSALNPNIGISEGALNPDENEDSVPQHTWS